MHSFVCLKSVKKHIKWSYFFLLFLQNKKKYSATRRLQLKVGFSKPLGCTWTVPLHFLSSFIDLIYSLQVETAQKGSFSAGGREWSEGNREGESFEWDLPSAADVGSVDPGAPGNTHSNTHHVTITASPRVHPFFPPLTGTLQRPAEENWHHWQHALRYGS